MTPCLLCFFRPSIPPPARTARSNQREIHRLQRERSPRPPGRGRIEATPPDRSFAGCPATLHGLRVVAALKLRPALAPRAHRQALHGLRVVAALKQGRLSAVGGVGRTLHGLRVVAALKRPTAGPGCRGPCWPLHGLRVVAALKLRVVGVPRHHALGPLHGLRVVAALKQQEAGHKRRPLPLSTASGSWPH